VTVPVPSNDDSRVRDRRILRRDGLRTALGVGLLFATYLLAGPRDATAETAQSPDRAETVTSSAGIVAADHPRASKVGARVLKRGGNAVDAGVATLLALGVVNPMSSGLGGGGFCLWRSADEGEVDVVDFREVAPKNASRDMYVVDGEVKESWMIRGGKAVGVPGEPAGLWAMSHKWGALGWKKVVAPALELARDGYQVRTELAERLPKIEDELRERPELADLFQNDDGDWLAAGTTHRRPELAKLLERLKEDGIAPYYRGPIADDIVEAVNAADGIFTNEDLRTYAIQMREPVVGEYRGYRVASMPPSSSGGTAIIETLNLLEGRELSKYGRSAQGIHYVVEALKHAFADRAGWLGDTDFVDVPIDRLTSESYARKLRDEIQPQGVLDPEEYGSKAPMPDKPGTTHLSVVDRNRNMLSCTSTVNLSFGSMVFVPEWGLVLNDEMGDFTPKPGEPNNYGLVGTEQNAVAPGKRPLSSMSPTLVLDPKGRPFMAVGASGGPTIITGTLFAFLNTVDFGMGPAQAITAPRIHHQWLPYKLYLEEPLAMKTELETFGHEVEVRPAYSNTQMIVRNDDGTFTGVSDPRKSGAPASSESVSAGDATSE
jgi:gamma-glutamyltranspeptidase/glutathione hydrolase